MKEAYAKFLRDYSAEKENAFVKDIHREIGHPYDAFSCCPVLLSRDRFQGLIAKTEAILTFLRSAKYVDEVRQKPWFLPQNSMNSEDYFGCADFSLNEEEDKLMEVNLGPAGRLGFVELPERAMRRHFPDWGKHAPILDSQNKLVEAISENRKYERIAVAVSHLESSAPLLPHYRYIAELLRKKGLEADVHYAKDISSSPEGKPLFSGKSYDRIFNLLIVPTWEIMPEAFASYTEFFRQRPEYFFPNPMGMRLAYKSLLHALWQKDLGEYGLNQEEIGLVRASSLRSAPLSQFTNFEELSLYFEGKPVVAKPEIGYRGKGVMIKPDRQQLEALMRKPEDQYMVQEYFEPIRIPVKTPASEAREMRQFNIRIGFVDGKLAWIRGYSFEHGLGKYYINPVVVL